MHFQAKSTLKNNHYHNIKYCLNKDEKSTKLFREWCHVHVSSKYVLYINVVRNIKLEWNFHLNGILNLDKLMVRTHSFCTYIHFMFCTLKIMQLLLGLELDLFKLC